MGISSLNMTTRSAYAAAVAVLALSGVGLATAADPAQPVTTAETDSVTFGNKVSLMGSGCPSGTATMNVSPDGQVVTISYSSFIVQSGKESGLRDRLKSCTADIPVRIPSGVALSLLDVTYRGTSLGLDRPGITAYQSAKYWLAGSPVTSVSLGGARPIVPDVGAEGDWSITDEFPAVSINPGCRAADSSLRMTSTMRVLGSGEALVSNDTTDLQSTALFRFAVKRCQP